MSKHNKVKNNKGPRVRHDRGCHDQEKHAERTKWKQNLQNFKDTDDFDDYEDYENFEEFE